MYICINILCYLVSKGTKKLDNIYKGMIRFKFTED